MRRVVVTGVGIVSSIGNDKRRVLNALRRGISGIEFVPAMRELGYRCQVAGLVKDFSTQHIGKRPLQTMSTVARYAAVATSEALADATLGRAALEGQRVGVVVGSALGGTNEAVRAEACVLACRRPTPVGAKGVMKILGSTAALNLAAWLGIKGRCYAVSSACATGADCIGFGFEMIRHDLLDLCICGGAEEQGIAHTWGFFDATSSMPTRFNDCPEQACRPYDRDRQGMVLSEGAGIVILEALERAKERGASIYAEMLGYGSTNDGDNMFEPTGAGLRRCLEETLASAAAPSPGRVDYINTHGTGTKVGDAVEVRVIAQLLGETNPLISSTKGLTGHSLGAVGAHEAIYTLLMLQYGFIVPTVNLELVAPECTGVRHVRTWMDVPFRTAMTFNAGLGGTNAGLLFRKL
jgi:3-oxoacyl-[acyl-carrier-protein] synthase-1